MPHLQTTEIECPEDKNIDCIDCPNHFICWEYDIEEIENLLIEKFMAMEEISIE